jgi:hypothetical protein
VVARKGTANFKGQHDEHPISFVGRLKRDVARSMTDPAELLIQRQNVHTLLHLEPLLPVTLKRKTAAALGRAGKSQQAQRHSGFRF